VLFAITEPFYEIASKEAREPNALVKAFRTLELSFYNLVAQLF